eukprot:scaffold549312_cov47-Prasinocladus_malaysianus.AAC.1
MFDATSDATSSVTRLRAGKKRLQFLNDMLDKVGGHVNSAIVTLKQQMNSIPIIEKESHHGNSDGRERLAPLDQSRRPIVDLVTLKQARCCCRTQTTLDDLLERSKGRHREDNLQEDDELSGMKPLQSSWSHHKSTIRQVDREHSCTQSTHSLAFHSGCPVVKR